MKRPSIPRRLWVWLVLALLALAIPLALWLRQPVAEYVLPPLTNWWSQLQSLWQMIPETQLWMGLVILSAAHAVFYFGRRIRFQSTRLALPQRSGRVGYWLGVLRMGRRAPPLVVRPLRYLFAQVIAQHENLTLREVLSQLQRESLPIPSHLQAFLNERRIHRPRVAKAVASPTRQFADETELEEIVRILEDYLEVPHES
jgi:hypothetical protein